MARMLRLAAVAAVGLLAVILLVPALRRDLVVLPLRMADLSRQINGARTAEEERAAFEAAIRSVRIWRLSPADRSEVPAYIEGRLPRTVRIEWVEASPLTGEQYVTVHRMISHSNWSVLARGILSQR